MAAIYAAHGCVFQSVPNVGPIRYAAPYPNLGIFPKRSLQHVRHQLTSVLGLRVLNNVAAAFVLGRG
jgi:hypothetical protein